MIQVNPMRVPGRWRDGFALDQHTLSSTFLGNDEYGHPQFSTTRSAVGELLYNLKYKTDSSTVAAISEVAAAFLKSWQPPIELILPIPSSKPRVVQPVAALANEIATRTGLPVDHGVVLRSKELPELKGVMDYGERTKLLTDAHAVDCSKVQGKIVLLFDDLYRSGATMNAVASYLYDVCGVKDVYVLTVTKTRSNA